MSAITRIRPFGSDCAIARIWSAQSIPAVLDGETVKLKSVTEIRYVPAVCRVLAAPREAREANAKGSGAS